MKISDLAKAAHTQTETIRFYERKGLLPEAARTDANYRLYDASHVQRLAFIDGRSRPGQFGVSPDDQIAACLVGTSARKARRVASLRSA